ncbi:L-alanine-DL-glutamate epimerase [Roseicitreum antarcticum]|uniref:L-alanine-DL-glutamate epimerase n=2 Tax=Roseicitreum antarcticum TaxID=564137 RepID=A0A1H2YL93_9RHOB|nr:L-alanine-DL-glutamate epimerase [Roseicitreum antarcticum]
MHLNASGSRSHKIAKVDVHLVSTPVTGGLADATRKVECVGFTVVRVTTDQGLEGLGLTYHEVGGEATRALILNNIAPKIIGRDPLETEVIWEDLFHYLRGVGRKGLTFGALSAVDLALWDLKGKIVDLPLYRLLGGNRTRVPIYASGGWTSYSDDELVAEMQDMVAQGYKHVKFKVGVDGAANPRRDAVRVRKVRDAVGPDIKLLLDANNCWDAATAVQFANTVRECDIMLFEEPVLADDIPGLARFKRGTDIPLATGEHEYTKYGARDLIIADAADIIQIDGTRAGGYTEMLKIAGMTQAWNLKFAPHAMEHMHLHLVSAVPNAPFLERLRLFEDVTDKVFKDAPLPVDGYMTVPDLPGHGLSLDMDFIRDADEAV